MKRLVILTVLCFLYSGCASDPVIDSKKHDLTRVEESKAIEKLDRAAKEEAVEPPPVPALPENRKQQAHWSYHGSHGPEYWGGIDSSYLLCSQGEMQSPVDLKWKRPASGKPLKFDYKSGGLEIVDNGHSIEVRVASGSFLNVGDRSFELKQLHFHSGSEHLLSGKQFPLEIHLVHKNNSGEIAVVGVFFQPGEESKSLVPILNGIPKEKNKPVKVDVQWTPASLLPQANSHYRYKGSLTTPPCSQGVSWYVMNTPMSLSLQQLLNLQSFYKGNFRPVQPLNSREVKNY